MKQQTLIDLEDARDLAKAERDEAIMLESKKYWQGFIDGMDKVLGDLGIVLPSYTTSYTTLPKTGATPGEPGNAQL